jgi:hypothetical protein
MDRKIPALAALALLIATPAAAEHVDGCLRPALGFDLFDGSIKDGSHFNSHVHFNGNGRVRLNGNGFCQNYRRVILTRFELESIRNAPRTVRNRIQANDLTYLCRCEGFRSPLCFTNGR